MPRLISVLCSVVLLNLSLPGFAEDQKPHAAPPHLVKASSVDSAEALQPQGPPEFSVRSTNEQGSLFWLPLGSFALPGLGQWIHGHPGYAALYGGIGLGGLIYGTRESLASQRETQADEGLIEDEDKDEDEKKSPFTDNRLRGAALGAKVYETMGSFSAYHSFRAAVRTRKPHGQFAFLNHEESIAELASAPFQFSHLANKSTWIPLSIFAGLRILNVMAPGEGMQERRLTGSDAFYTGSFSYSAGVGEELMFRGWLMPLLREKWGSNLSANLVSSGLFALAHGVTPVPIFQFVAGWYFGYITQANEWKLGEAIFLHSWWDVIAFASDYAIQKKKKGAAAAVLWLPKLSLVF